MVQQPGGLDRLLVPQRDDGANWRFFSLIAKVGRWLYKLIPWTVIGPTAWWPGQVSGSTARWMGRAGDSSA